MNTKYYIQMFARLEPKTPWQVGRVADTDVLSLDDAARFASKQAGTEILPADFLRAAARGEISLKAIVHHDAKLKKHDGGIYCNQGLPTENTTPKGAIPTLPLSACQQLANAGRASWRTYDGFESVDDELMRFTIATLDDGEPDFETVPTDCRVMGWDARALADAYIDKPATKGGETPQAASSGAPKSAEPPAQSIVAQSTTTIHRVEIRKNILSAVIATAKKSALDPDDPHSHWAAFVKLAESDKPPSPLIGFAEEEGVKYQGELAIEFLTRSNFLRRVRRQSPTKTVKAH